MNELHDEIEKYIKNLLLNQGYDLIELKIYKYKKDHFLEILADHFCGGITIKECSLLNKDIRRMLDEKNFFQTEYTVEVSSPGIDRPLTNEKDFLRNIGKRIQIYLKNSLKEKIDYEGILESVDDQKNVLIRTEKGIQAVALDAIAQAIQNI